MGFTLLRAPGPMIAIKPAKAHGGTGSVRLFSNLLIFKSDPKGWLALDFQLLLPRHPFFKNS